MKLRKVSQLKDLKGKKVILRVDYNTPFDSQGNIADDTRITSTLKTINFLKDAEAKIIIISHLGRPKGKVVEKLRLTKVAEKLSELLKLEVKKAPDAIGEETQAILENMQEGEIVMLENIRFHKEEKENDSSFSKTIASYGDLYVNDAFGAAHRAHSSTVGITEHLPAYSGLLMEKEIEALTPLIADEPKRPLTMIFGGAKIDTKIGVIKNFLDKADYFLLGGALANTFLAAAGYNVAQSLYEEDKIETAREIMMECEKHKERFILPHDVVVASDISANSETLDIPIEDVIGDMKILDIGKWTAEKFCNIIADSGTVIWNGPLGLTEYEPFQQGTKSVANCLAESSNQSIIGGGDTLEAIKQLGIAEEKFTHISTGGGACVEFLSGEKLPGITPLLEK
jgi:phosphoglycerate kinase